MQSKLGRIGICEDGTGITDVFFDNNQFLKKAAEKETELLLTAANQLVEYFNGERTTFNIPLSLKGTPFQLEVWNALCTILYGETRSYKQIAEQIGSPKSYRAVGAANHINPIGIIIPCHRVIGANKKLIGYAGGLDRKEKLLKLEGIVLS